MMMHWLSDIPARKAFFNWDFWENLNHYMERGYINEEDVCERDRNYGRVNVWRYGSL